MSRGHRIFSSCQVSRILAVIVLSVMVASVGGPALPSSAQQASVASPSPQPDSVVRTGTTLITADVEGATDPVLYVDGEPIGPLGPDGIQATLGAGANNIEILDGDSVLRQWTVFAADLDVDTAPADLVELGLRASGSRGGTRPVLLVNPDVPSLALAAGPVAEAAGAVLLPTGTLEIDPDVLTRITALRAVGDEILVLGGLDAVGNEVLRDLRNAGFETRRIGSGSPGEVAAEGAREFASVGHYVRGGGSRSRPLLVAPSQPLAEALQASAWATAHGASLVLSENGEIGASTADVIATRTTVWLADGLSGVARDAATAAADDDADVSEVDVAPAPTDDLVIVDSDVDPGVAVFATRAARPGIGVLFDVGRARTFISRNTPGAVTIAGAALTPGQARADWVDGPEAAELTGTLSEVEPLQVFIDSARQIEAAVVYVSIHGVEWPGQVTMDGQQAVWTAGPRPTLPPDEEPSEAGPAPVRVTGVVASEGHLSHIALSGDVTIGPTSNTSPEGFLVAGGSSDVVGSGPTRRYSVEIEPGTGLNLAAVTAEVQSILLDTERGWTATGVRSLQRVGSSAAADIRVVVARPGTVDAFCGRVGLGTGGTLSCWDGRRAMLNLTRWNTGVSPFHTDLTVYRQYLVNHEVGHGLGFSHVNCPGSGQIGPVMMQQSKGLQGCQANGWPYP